MAGYIEKVKTRNGIRYRAQVNMQGQRRSKTFPMKADAREWVRLMEGRGNSRYMNNKNTLGEMVEQFLEANPQRLGQARRFEFWGAEFGYVKLNRLDENQAVVMDRSLRSLNKFQSVYNVGIVETKQPVSLSTRNRYRSGLRTILKWIEKERLANGLPIHVFVNEKEPKGRSRYIGSEGDKEFEALSEACRNAKYEKMYLFLLIGMYTGMRVSEFREMRWSRIDWKECKIHLPANTTKNGQPREVHFPPQVVAELKQKNKIRLLNNDFVFNSTVMEGQPVSYQTLRGWFYEVQKQAGIKVRINIHDLRHTFATMLAKNGVSVPLMQQLTGHKSQVSLQRYIHVNMEDAVKEQMRVFGKAK